MPLEGNKRVATGGISHKGKSICVLGDSIVKDIKPYLMKKAIPACSKMWIKSFSGATTECMNDYVTPSLKSKPDIVLLHCGTNDLRSDLSPETIAKNIINLALRLKTSCEDVIVSGLLARNDQFNNTGIEVNKFLVKRCLETNTTFCSNSAVNSRQHLNRGGLHLNTNGTVCLANSFIKVIER